MLIKHLLLLICTKFLYNEAFNKNFDEFELWIEQKLDHFNESDKRTWQMRYLASDNFFKPGGPIIINVNGEWNVEMKSELSGISYELVELFQGYSVQTEHRYYGKSTPVQNLTVENLQYLTISQALADLAHFIRYKKSTDLRLSNSKVILIGCSYAGALAVYFRKDYPDLVDAVWSAGAALYFRLDYSDSLVSVGRSMRKIGGDICYERVEHLSKSYLMHKKRKDAVYDEIVAQNLTEALDSTDMVIAIHVQHRNISMMRAICKNITLVDSNDIIGFGKLIELLKSKIPATKKDDVEFSENDADRQYLYQSCNELGNFLTSSSKHQPFGDTKPFSTVIAECKEKFGAKFTIDYINGKIEALNARYGAQEPNVDRVYFTKAEDDPWRWPGVKDECATVIPGIGHCHELRARSEKDLPETAAAKQRGIHLLWSWINGGKTVQNAETKCWF